MNLLKLFFGTKNQRDIKRIMPLVHKVNALEEQYQSLSEEELKQKTVEFKARLAQGETLDAILPEAFATVKNACRRLVGTTCMVCGHELTWNMIPFDVQIVGGIVLHQGKIAEMQTGEGKTLVATFPLYLNALSGQSAHLVTVNDYLARRDAQFMGHLFTYLGLTVGCIQNSMSPAERRAQYACDITYGTNSEFGFDYLRDNGMATDPSQVVQRGHAFAIVDEVDSILIDEARTPLIISGPSQRTTSGEYVAQKPRVERVFREQTRICTQLLADAKQFIAQGDNEMAMRRLYQVYHGTPKNKQFQHLIEEPAVRRLHEQVEGMMLTDMRKREARELKEILLFTIDEKTREVALTDKGAAFISPDDPEMYVVPDLPGQLAALDGETSLSAEERSARRREIQEGFAAKSERLHIVDQLLRAYALYNRDEEYVVQDNKVLIVDEHTGRILPGRRFSDGLHQALEAKENVVIEKETQTLATITIQNYFRMYEKLAGMTGTAETEATEFHQIYKLDVVVIPTNRPCRRVDQNDCVFKTKREKFNAIIAETEQAYRKGQPVLLGTISVEDSEVVSRMLKRRNIPHNVLNAKNHAMESEIVARAGQRCAVTVATNMAGRGTDIKLGEGVEELGGLLVLGSARHDSRRIDRQLRGRSARQGDPGASHFYVSLEDNLMRLFGSDRIVKIMERFGMEEGEELQHPWLNKSIETAQRRVEQHHFSIRKRTLEYDDVMNKQREVIYGFRKKTLFDESCRDSIFDILEIEVDRHLNEAIATNPSNSKEPLNKAAFMTWLGMTFPIVFNADEIIILDGKGNVDVDKTIDAVVARVSEMYDIKASLESSPEALQWLERHIILDAIDRLWQDHLRAMDDLRGSIGLRAYAQKDPLVEYKKEAFNMFDQLMNSIDQEILHNVFRSATTLESFEHFMAPPKVQLTQHHQSIDDLQSVSAGASMQEPEPEVKDEIPITFRRELPKIGPNEPCPCGSGKKYKKCCGK